MNVGNIEVSSNIFETSFNSRSKQSPIQEPLRLEIYTYDRSALDKENYGLIMAAISLGSFSSARSLLKSLKNEKDANLRNALVKELIKILLEGILNIRILFLSKAALKRLAKQLKEICKDLDEMIKEGLIELDPITKLGFNCLKQFANCPDDEMGNENSLEINTSQKTFQQILIRSS